VESAFIKDIRTKQRHKRKGTSKIAAKKEASNDGCG